MKTKPLAPLTLAAALVFGLASCGGVFDPSTWFITPMRADKPTYDGRNGDEPIRTNVIERAKFQSQEYTDVALELPEGLDEKADRWIVQTSSVIIHAYAKPLTARYLDSRKAQFTFAPSIYTIAYDGNKPAAAQGSVTGSTASSSHTYNVPQNLTPNGYSLTDWGFMGWNTKADGNGKNYADGEIVMNLTAEDSAVVTLYAKWAKTVINLSSPPASGMTKAGWDYSGGVYTIKNGANVSIIGSTATDCVVVEGTATVTLNGASIVLSSGDASPLDLASGANLTLKLTGTNTLTAADNGAGIRASTGTTLTITSIDGNGQTNGTLTVTGGGAGGAGIGGARSEAGGTITIAGGTVNAQGGGMGPAGIGGSYGGSGGVITITGGRVNATGGSQGAGIGGGYNGGGSGDITINYPSGTSTGSAAGGMYSAGIGPGAAGGDGSFNGVAGGWPTANPYSW